MKVRIKNFNGELPEYLTEGKEYDFTMDCNGNGGLINNDFGSFSYIKVIESAHLNGGSWEVVE